VPVSRDLLDTDLANLRDHRASTFQPKTLFVAVRDTEIESFLRPDGVLTRHSSGLCFFPRAISRPFKARCINNFTGAKTSGRPVFTSRGTTPRKALPECTLFIYVMGRLRASLERSLDNSAEWVCGICFRVSEVAMVEQQAMAPLPPPLWPLSLTPLHRYPKCRVRFSYLSNP
jgi:hypothetical protein